MKKSHGVPLIMIFCLVFLSLTAHLGAETIDVVFLKVGSGPAEVGAATPDQAVDDFTGPTSFAVGPDGTLFLLDAPHFCVKLFSLTGTFVRSIPYPRATDAGKPILGIDLAVDASGTLFVANATQGLIWKFDSQDGSLLKTFGSTDAAAERFELVQRIAVAPDGDLLVADGMTTNVYRLAGDGRRTALYPESFFPPVFTPGNALVIVKPETDGNRVNVGLFASGTADIRHLGAVDLDKPVLHAAAVGCDARGHIYVFVVVGETDDQSEAAYIIELDAAGQTARRLLVPESPGIGMNRYLAVSPDSRVFMAQADETTFRIVEFR